MSSTFFALFEAVVLVVDAGVPRAPVVPAAVFGFDFVDGVLAVAGFALVALGFDVDCAVPDREVACVEPLPEPCDRCGVDE